MEHIDKIYTVLIDEEAHNELAAHAEFLARVSIDAAERRVNGIYDEIAKLDHNPARFPHHINELHPDGDYRSMVTTKRYKIICEIMEDHAIVHVVNVLDCRMDDASEEP